MTRKVHLVGAWPGRSPAHAMERALAELAPHLLRMTDGETGGRSWWIRPTMEALRANPDLELAHDGDYTDHQGLPEFRVRDGRRFEAANIQLGYLSAFEASFRGFKVLRERFGRPDLLFQVGIPHPLDLSIYSFGEAGFSNPDLREAFAQATLRQIGQIAAVGGGDVVFQIETVVNLVGVTRASPGERADAAEQFGAGLAAFAARCPQGTRFGLHLCLGDSGHWASAQMDDLKPLIVLANAVGRAWPEHHSLDFVHGPLTTAEQPPSFDASFYEPLADLELPADTRFVAGFVHEAIGEAEHRELLALIESVVGGEVDVAAACGLGRRRSADAALAAMRKMRVLVE